MAMRQMSRSRLTKKLNKLLWYGNLDEAHKLIQQYPRLAKACIPYLANDGYRRTVILLLNEGGDVH